MTRHWTRVVNNTGWQSGCKIQPPLVNGHLVHLVHVGVFQKSVCEFLSRHASERRRRFEARLSCAIKAALCVCCLCSQHGWFVLGLQAVPS